MSNQAIFRGDSRLVLGRERCETSETGVEVDVNAGDVIVIPAGVSHRSISSTEDYRYIGVYPEVRIAIVQEGTTTEMISRLHQNGAIIYVKERSLWKSWKKKSVMSEYQTTILFLGLTGPWSRFGRRHCCNMDLRE